MPGQFFRHSGQRLQKASSIRETAASVNMLVNQPGDHQLIGRSIQPPRLLIRQGVQSRNPFPWTSISFGDRIKSDQYYSIF